MPYRTQTPQEELLNAIIHGAGLLFAIIATPFLISKAGSNFQMVWAVCMFAFGMISVYFSSTLYHLANNPVLKRRSKILDHICIFFLIGGTYTPIILLYLQQSTSLIFLSIQWSLIAVGTILKIFYTGRYEALSVAIYIIIGWMLLLVLNPLLKSMPLNIFEWIIAGGLSYTVGVIFYRLDYKKYAHNVWHCFVLTGTIFHFIAIYKSLS